jgi:hypothetical protein
MNNVTMPQMAPVAALRNARQLTKAHRQWLVRKILLLAVVLLIVSAIFLIPILMLVPAIAGLILFLLGTLMLPYVHSYFYHCYRELLP